MNKIIVGISDQKLCKSPDVLVTYALGSCVGICMIDKVLGIAGLAHIMLPDSALYRMTRTNSSLPIRAYSFYMKA